MPLTFQTGNTFVNGDSATSTKLNNQVNLASYTGSLEIAAGGTGATALFGAGGIFTTFGINNGTQLHSSTKGLTVGDTATTQIFQGQDATHGLVFQWTYNSTPANATALITTYGQNNSLKFQATNFSFDTTSLANAVQLNSAGRTLFGVATDDGVSSVQVKGGLNYDRARSVVVALSYASTVTLNFSTLTAKSGISLTGNLTLATSNLANGCDATIIITADSTPRTLTFPAGWVFVGAGAPASLAASKTIVLTLSSLGTTDANVIAAYAVQN